MAGGAPFSLTTGPGTKIEQNDAEIIEAAEVINFEGSVSVIDEGNGKVTVTVTAGAVDPFATALFDGDSCDPLFDKLPNCQVELLQECG